MPIDDHILMDNIGKVKDGFHRNDSKNEEKLANRHSCLHLVQNMKMCEYSYSN